MSRANEPPTLYEWAGAGDAFERLTEVFYRRIPDDELLADLFADMPAEHPHHVAQWLTEVFGGPARYIEDHGGYPHMVRKAMGSSTAVTSGSRRASSTRPATAR